jgi:predicted DNA-binding WGR domain protein
VSLLGRRYTPEGLFAWLHKGTAEKVAARPASLEAFDGHGGLKAADKKRLRALVAADLKVQAELAAAEGGAAGAGVAGAKGKATGDGGGGDGGGAAAAAGSGGAVTYLECTAGGESKFWSIALAGDTTRVRYGPIGEEGSVSQKKHKDAAAATKFKVKMSKEKLGKGYAEVEK